MSAVPAKIVDAKTSVEESPLAVQLTVSHSTPPHELSVVLAFLIG